MDKNPNPSSISKGDCAPRLCLDAVELIHRLNLRPIPEVYELLYAYAAGTDEKIAGTINRALGENRPLSKSELNQLLDCKSQSSIKEQQLDKFSCQLSEQVSSASSLVQKAVQSTETLGATLENAEVELADIKDPKTLISIVADLANATKELGRDGAELRMKLNEASDQISKLKEDLEITRADSLTDSLTQTDNREAFDQKIAAEITEAKANGSPLCLCMIDADHFKNFNDTHGHRAGDSALQLIASVLKSAVRDHDIVARYGGEEFAIILTGADLATGLIVAERTRQSLADKKLTKRGTGENLGNITVSIGLAQLSTNDSTDSLVERADSCLYQAKNAGRNCVVTESSIPDQQGDLATRAG